MKGNIKTEITERIKDLSKQKTVMIMTFIIFVLGTIFIFSDSNKDVLEKIFLGSIFSCIVQLPVTKLTEKLSSLKKYLVQGVSAAAAVVLGYFARCGFGNSVYEDMYFYGLILIAVFLTIYVFALKEDNGNFYAHLIKNFMFAGLMSFVLFLGLILLCYAFNYLIYRFSYMDRWCLSITLFSFGTFFVNVFAVYLFNQNNEESTGKAFRIIFVNILFPVFVILMVLLYAYLLKALFTLSLPNGQINIFVSFATAIYFVFYFILKEYKDKKIISFFYKYGVFTLIPLVIIQIVAFVIRLNAYGFTGSRYSSLMYIIFSCLEIAFILSKKDKLKKLTFPLLALLMLWTSFSPLNLIEVSYESQIKRLSSIVEKYGMLKDDELSYDSNEIAATISEEDLEVLKGSWRYLRQVTKHKKPSWMPDSWSFESAWGFDTEKKVKNTKNVRINANDSKPFSIEGFSKCYSIDVNNYGINNLKAGGVSFDFEKYLLPLADNDVDSSEPVIITIDEDKKFIFSFISYDYDLTEKEFKHCILRGILLIK